MRRVFAFPLLRLGLIVLLFAALATPLVLFVHPHRGTWPAVGTSWALALLLFGSVAIVERFAAGKNLQEIGLGSRNALRDLLLGITLGAGLFSLVIVELAAGGFYRVTGVHASPDLAIAALLLFPGALTEELLFRGALFRLVEELGGTWIALAISSAFFGLAHAANPGATWVSSLAIALEAGLLLGLALVAARNLWLPIGLHFAWNFFEGPIFGAEISGRSFLSSALSARISGPAVLTGGGFGPEAGLAAIVTCLIAAGALLAVASHRHLIKPAGKWSATKK
jgi:membrane protease YdiL (CAAX protease family)